MSGALKISRDARGVATLTLARPERHNALNAALMDDLHDAARALGADPAIRVVVLAAEGESFCAGGDLDWMRAQFDADREGRMREAARLAQMLRALDDLPKPLVARVQGAAYGGGVGLMAVSDVVVAVREARFALTEVRLGLIPATIGPYVVRRIGEGASRRLFFNPKSFDAEEARSFQLVSAVTDAAGLDAAVEAEVKSFLSGAPGAIAEAKALCKELARGSGDPMALTMGKLAERWDSEEAHQGIAAFFDRRKPPWNAG